MPPLEEWPCALEQLAVAAAVAVGTVWPAMAAVPRVAVGEQVEVAAEGGLVQAWAVPLPSSQAGQL